MKKSTTIYAACALSNFVLVFLQERTFFKALFFSASLLFTICAIWDLHSRKGDE